MTLLIIMLSLAYLSSQGQVYCALIETDTGPVNTHSLACTFNSVLCSFGKQQLYKSFLNSQSTPTALIRLYSISQSFKGYVFGLI